ncbi:MAG: hypothetical protein ACREFX_11685 [Opitutaceae bacterium]
MKTNRKRDIRVRLPRPLLAKLEAEATETGMDVTALILRAVESDLRRTRPRRRR